MPKRWTDDDILLNSVANDLLGTMSMFPKRIVRVDELIRSFGMPLSHIQILVLVSEGDLSIGQISERLGIAKPNITPLVDLLDERGYVCRERSARDRRVVCVHLQDAGRDKLKEIRDAMVEQIRAWPECFSAREIRRLDQGLQILKQTMDIMNGQT